MKRRDRPAPPTEVYSPPVAEPVEIRALRRENDVLKRRLDAARGGEEIILQAVQQAWEERPDLSVPPAPKLERKRRQEIALLHVTDTQIGKLTETYSSAVAETRLSMLARKAAHITEIRRSAASIDECILLLGGDMVEGENIFPSQAFQIDQGLFEQACKTAPAVFVRLILSLLATFKRVRVESVCGNHGRPGLKSMGAHPHTNWDRVAYQTTRNILLGTDENPRRELADRLTFNISPSFYAIAYAYDWGALLVHGDQIRGGFAGFPWYGTAKSAWGWIDSIPEEWDNLYFGHFHQHASAVLNYRTFYATASPESGNVYAQEQMKACGWPSQRLQFYDRDQGVIADHQVFLCDPKERRPQRVRRRAA